MVHEANIKQANAEKQLKEALGKVTICGGINCTRIIESSELRSASQPQHHCLRHTANLTPYCITWPLCQDTLSALHRD